MPTPHSIEDALALADLAEQMVQMRYRRENPDASDAEIEAMFQRWLAERPGAEHGDAEGQPCTLPRRR